MKKLLLPFGAAMLLQAAPMIAHAQVAPGTPPNCTDLGNGYIRDGVVSCAYLLKVNSDGSINTVSSGGGGGNVNITQVNTQAVTAGAGASAPGTLRVITATDSTIGTLTTITNPVAVTGTFWQATQPVSGTITANAGSGTFAISASSLPLPTGAMQQTGGTVGLVAGSAVIGHVIADTGSTTAVTGSVAATQSGTWTLQPGNTANTTPWLQTLIPSSAATAGIAPVVSTSTESCHVFKASAGNLYSASGTITGSGYVLIFDATSAPVDGAVTPKVVIQPAAAGSWSISYGVMPAAFATGIVACTSSTGPFTKTALVGSFFSGNVQ